MATRYISENDVSLLQDWRKDPANWKIKTMTRMESHKVDVNKSTEEIYNFISNFNNFNQLMPSTVQDLETKELALFP